MKRKILETIKQFKHKKIAIIGDLMLDKYVWGKVDRISPEAPVPVVDVDKDDYKIGAAGNVALNIESLGGKPYLFSVIGDDGYGRMLTEILEEKNINAEGVTKDPTRQTTLKIRIIAHSQQVVRIDYEDRHPITDRVHSSIIEQLEKVKPDAIIIEDYNKGLLTVELIRDICKVAEELGVVSIVDPHPTRDYSFYQGVDGITPNRKEAYNLIGAKPETPVEEVGQQILDKLNLDFSVITLGEDGMMIFADNKIKHIPTHAREVFDVTGAGDTVISIFTMAMACTPEPETAAFIANVGAGLVVSEIGAGTVTADEIINEIKKYE